MATTIAQIACFKNSLPQGSPCSPILSELIFSVVDVRLSKIAQNNGLTYTRYCDDLSFSTGKKELPKNIAYRDLSHTWLPGAILRKTIKRAGFRLNQNKFRVQYAHSRQEVTGLTVNDGPNISKKYLKYTRSICDHLFRSGVAYDPKTKRPLTKEQIIGRLSYVSHVKIRCRPKEEHHSYHRRCPKQVSGLTRDVLAYYNFHNSDRPFLICEGKTDYIHLKFAIFAKQKKFPDLLTTKDGKTSVALRMQNIESTLMKMWIPLEGAAPFKNLVSNYQKIMSRFSVPKLPKSPVLLVLDFDKAGKQYFSIIKAATSSKNDIDGLQPYYFIKPNLYILFLHKENISNVEMEDLYQEADRSRVLNGKHFSRSNNYDKLKNYGKSDFALKVIGKNHNEVDFGGFEDILSRLQAAISDYYSGK